MLFYYELKKIIHQRLFQFVLCFSLGIIGLLFVFEIQSHGVYDNEGSYHTGIQESQMLVENRHILNGNMNDQLIQNVLETYDKVFYKYENDYDDHELSTIAIGKEWQLYSNLGDLLIRTYSDLKTYDASVLENVKRQDIRASDIFFMREQQLFTVLNMNLGNQKAMYSESEKDRIRQMIPISISDSKATVYEDATGWDVLLENLYIINILVLLIAAVIGASIFSRDTQAETAPIIYTTKKGLSKAILVKFSMSIVCILSIAVIIHILYAILILSTFSMSGRNTLIQYQAKYWLSIFPITNVQAYLLVCGLSICGNIVMLLVSMIFSRFCKKEYVAIMCSLLFLFIPFIISIPYPIFPADMSNGVLQLMTISIHSYFHIPILTYELQVCITVLSLSVVPLIYYSFQKNRKHKILKKRRIKT